MKNNLLAISVVICFAAVVQAQTTESNVGAGPAQPKQDIIKKGLSLGPLPIIAFDQDRGLQYGALLNIFDFGDGSYYPHPRQQWYVEAAAFTKGTRQFFLTYDTRNLIPNVRMSLAATVMMDQAMDFYGYNGYQAIYQADSVNYWQNRSNKDGMPSEYMTAFYRLDRRAVSVKADFVGKLPWKNWFWQGSYLVSNYRYRPIDRDIINKGRPDNEKFHGPTLYEKYIDWGIIPETDLSDPEKKLGGGFVSAPRIGLMYDSRDFEAAPSRGIWAEANFAFAPKFLGTTHSFNRYMLIWRHYIPIANENLVFAYRLNYQGSIGNYLPFYMMPVFSTIGREWERDGLGGYRTIRGIMRGRIQSLDKAFFNTELRWRFTRFTVANQNVMLALNAFVDGGLPTRFYDNFYRGNAPVAPEMYKKYVNISERNRLHVAAGGGFRVIINRNFIIAVDYATPFNNQNGNGGMYINTGYLF